MGCHINNSILSEKMNGQAEMDVDYKRKYKNLKRKLKFLVYVSFFFLMLALIMSIF